MPDTTADELTEGDVAAIAAAADQAWMLYDEIRERDPSVKAAGTLWQDERTAATGLVRDAYVAAGVSQLRADRAATVWFLSPRHEGPPAGPREWLAEADGIRWRQHGDPPG